MKYKFNKTQCDEDIIYKPDRAIYSYYQICTIKNSNTGKYAVRKAIFNEMNEIIKIYEREYSKDVLSKFMKTLKQNKFKTYPTNDLDQIAPPNYDDLYQCSSSLLNNNFDGDFSKPL